MPPLPRVLSTTAVLLALLSAWSVTAAPANSAAETERSPASSDGDGVDDALPQVHIIAHTHDDVGWKKTVDQYYYGTNNTITTGAVQYILDSVITALVADPAKKFSYVEMAFFFRWWREQDDARKAQVRTLVQNGQLEFVGGGWCMNDEAGTHYNAIVDQITFGHAFITDQFGARYRPRMAWQIDPFGHSSVQAAIFAQMGYDGLYFARADYEDKGLRQNQSRLEMVWRGSPVNLGQQSDLFTGMFYGGYGPPAEFQFDTRFSNPMVVKDDPLLEDPNVKQLVDDFVKTIGVYLHGYRTKHVMFPMGSDFAFSAGLSNFKNLDKLIKHVRADGRVDIFYSTPARYLDAVNAEGLAWELKTDDFFPYADRPHAYWTGYFTSRPALKRYVRASNALLQSCKQIETADGVAASGADSFSLKEAMGVAQHHDAVSGTEQQHVANDYAKRLHAGSAECQSAIASHVSGVLGLQRSDDENDAIGDVVGDVVFCDLLNVSICDISTERSFKVILYNPLGHARVSKVRMPVAGNSYTISDPAVLGFAVTPVLPGAAHARGKRGNTTLELVMLVNLPPTTLVTINVLAGSEEAAHDSSHATLDTAPSANVDLPPASSDPVQYSISNDFYIANFSEATGKLTSITDRTSGRTTSLFQEFLWYESYNKTQKHDQPSGAYIFRSKGDSPHEISGTCTVSFFKQPGLLEEARQQCGDFVYQTVGLYKGLPHVEFTFTVGPIPIGDHVGKEVISRFTSDLDTGASSTFYTDANGRELQKRVYNHRATWTPNMTVFEKVAGNFYPVNSRIVLRDGVPGTQLTVLTDSSQAGASLASGQLELMVHRRILVDDSRGVDEPLNETGVDGKGLIVQGTHYLQLSPIKSAAALHRPLAQEIMLPPLVMFTAAATTQVGQRSTLPIGGGSGNSSSLPKNIHLLTLQRVDFDPASHESKSRLVRFEHFFEVGEDEELSKPATVDVQEYLKNAFGIEVVAMTEMTLSANQVKSEERRLVWKVAGEDTAGVGVQRVTKRSMEHPADDFTITLNPMDIRTFLLTVQ